MNYKINILKIDIRGLFESLNTNEVRITKLGTVSPRSVDAYFILAWNLLLLTRRKKIVQELKKSQFQDKR